MKKAKPEHRRDYWKYHVAAHSFELAGDTAQALLSMDDKQPMYNQLMVSLHVLYARPFRHTKESRNIADSMVPSNYKDVHKMLMDMRDRIFAHHDKDSRIIDEVTGIDLFQLLLIVSNGEMRPATQLLFPTAHQLTKVHALCIHLYRCCFAKGAEALERCLNKPPCDGVYRISTDFESRSPLLISSELCAEQSRCHLSETKRRPHANQ